MLRRFTKKRTIAALSVIAVLAVAGAAFAYFSSSGSGSGQASVGKSSSFVVAVSTDSTGTLLPDNGASSETLTYSVTNNASFSQQLTSTATSVASDTTPGSPTLGDVLAGGSPVSGCLASWFHTADTSPAPATIAPNGGSVNGSVKVTMDDSTANQDNCQGISPDISVSAN